MRKKTNTTTDHVDDEQNVENTSPDATDLKAYVTPEEPEEEDEVPTIVEVPVEEIDEPAVEVDNEGGDDDTPGEPQPAEAAEPEAGLRDAVPVVLRAIECARYNTDFSSDDARLLDMFRTWLDQTFS